MSSSEKIAIAAHLHVLLRRKTGRVTDTEWMACNPEYAQEVIRLAHQKAAEGGHDDLGLLADRLEAAMALPERPAARPLAQRVSEAVRAPAAHALGPGPSRLGVLDALRPGATRYVSGLR